MIEKVLLITKALYSESFILFMFNNAINYLLYAEVTLYIYKINKKPVNKQVILCNGWYINQIDIYHIQPMWYLGLKKKPIPKKILKLLTEKELWLATGLNLKYSKLKYYNY